MSKSNKDKSITRSDSFLYSLGHTKDEEFFDKDSENAKIKKEEKKRTIIRNALIGVFAIIFIVSCFSIVKTLVGYKNAESFYNNMFSNLDGNTDNAEYPAKSDELSALADFSTANSPEDSFKVYSSLFSRMKSRILSLRQINPDVYGWIIVPGTENIDYPIMRGEDNEFYLNHEYSYGYLEAGSIFLDYRCDYDINGNFNTVIYGHNMQNGLMFSEIIKFMDEDFFNANKYIYVYTDSGMFTYEIFSAYKTDYKYKYIETGFPSYEDFFAFAEEMKNNSYFKRDVTFDTNSRMLTLSTCTNGRWSDRYCVQALMIDSFNAPIDNK